MAKVFTWIGKIINKKPKTILITSLIIFVLLITGALNIKMATGNETLVEETNEVYIANEKMEESFGGDSIIVLYKDKTDNFGLSLSNIEKLLKIEKEFQDEDNVFSIMSVTSILKQLMLKESNNKLELPPNQMMLDNILYIEDEINPLFEDVMLNNKEGVMVFKLAGNLNDEEKEEMIESIEKVFSKTEFNNTSYTITGKPVLDNELKSEMRENMMIMVSLAVIVMIIILSLIFKVRWRMLSLGIIFVSVIATLGLMGYVGVSVTMVSMAVFPILIGLGIDYSIQLHNRYEEDNSLIETIKQIGKAVGIAVL